MHGYVGDGPSTWRPQLDALADDFDMIAIDLPGAGASDDPPESFGMRGFADALAGFITALGLTGSHLVGLSFGGAALIELSRLSPNELVAALAPTMFTPDAPADITQGFAESLQRFHPHGLRAMARAVTEDLTDALGSIHLPTLLVYGEHDTRAPAGVANKIHDAIPGSELIQLSDAGHVCNVDASERFNAHLRRFIHDHISAGGPSQ